MISYFDLSLRLSVWFLLTADASPANILIGIAVALVLPRRHSASTAIKEWLRVIGQIIIAIPQAYMEAVEIMVRPHRYETVVQEQVRPHRTAGLIFLDIFLITFTPKTIVLNYRDKGWYDVHHVQRRPALGPSTEK